jgi:hypothetical protein
VIELFHPISVLSSVDGCPGFVEQIFPGAEQIQLVWTPVEASLEGGLVSYTADVSVSYPTGVNQYPIHLVVGKQWAAGPAVHLRFLMADTTATTMPPTTKPMIAEMPVLISQASKPPMPSTSSTRFSRSWTKS